MVAAAFAFPPAVHKGSSFSTSLKTAFVTFLGGVLVVDILIPVRQYPSVVLICMFLLSDIEHFFIHLLAICVSSLEMYQYIQCLHLLSWLILWCCSF